MFKLDKSTVLKYYCLTTILCLDLYKIITRNHVESSNNYIQLSIGLNLVFVSYYLFFKDNVVLNGSENLKTFFVACSSEYLLIQELVKLLGKSKDLTIYYTNYAYFGLILLHLGLYQRYRNVFKKFIKFNFGFSTGYLTTIALLQDYNYIHILVSLVISIIGNYYNVITLDLMTVYCTNFIYFTTLLEAIYTLTYLIPTENVYFAFIINIICAISAFYIYLSTINAQFKDLENKVDDSNLKGEKLLEVV